MSDRVGNPENTVSCDAAQPLNTGVTKSGASQNDVIFSIRNLRVSVLGLSSRAQNACYNINNNAFSNSSMIVCLSIKISSVPN